MVNETKAKRQKEEKRGEMKLERRVRVKPHLALC